MNTGRGVKRYAVNLSFVRKIGQHRDGYLVVISVIDVFKKYRVARVLISISDLEFGISAVGDMHKVTNFRSKHLFVF